MTASDLTLKQVQQQAEGITRVHRVSDFLTKEKKLELKLAQEARAVKKKRSFDDIDAYSAEILGRFGYEAWNAWQSGLIRADKMLKMVLAERARFKREMLGIEGIILSAVAGANHRAKGKPAPKSLQNAVKIFKIEQKQAKGVVNG